MLGVWILLGASQSVSLSSSAGVLPSPNARTGASLPVSLPGRSYSPLRYRDHSGLRFNITLSYPDGERPLHLYSVFYGMPVSGLRYHISCLLRVDFLVSLFVGPLWLVLNHRGTISDRVLPGTSTPCPLLEPGSEVRVHQVRNPAVSSATFADHATTRRALAQDEIDLMNTTSVDGISLSLRPALWTTL